MSLVDPFEGTMLDGEHEWLSRIVADPLDDDQKLVYADWLEEHGSDRAGYLRKLVTASKSMQAATCRRRRNCRKGGLSWSAVG
jgi:uncharacterized protein (TIGR02996 family)